MSDWPLHGSIAVPHPALCTLLLSRCRGMHSYKCYYIHVITCQILWWSGGASSPQQPCFVFLLCALTLRSDRKKDVMSCLPLRLEAGVYSDHHGANLIHNTPAPSWT